MNIYIYIYIMLLRNNTIHYKVDPDRFNKLIHYRDDLKGMSLKRKIENFNGTRNNNANRINLSRGNSGSDNKKSQRHKRLEQNPTLNNERMLYSQMEKYNQNIEDNQYSILNNTTFFNIGPFPIGADKYTNRESLRKRRKTNGHKPLMGGASRKKTKTRKNRKKRKTRKRKQKIEQRKQTKNSRYISWHH